MCGRFSLAVDPALILKLFPDLTIPDDFVPRYNIAPTQGVLGVHASHDAHHMARFHWGLIPFWAKDRKIGNSLINARAESLASKPAFRAAYQKRRCLVLADGFYEWRAVAGRKTPLYIHRPGGEPFAFAGLWERWIPPEPPDSDPLLSCTIVTTASNALIRPLHDRMPVIVEPRDYERWLDPQARDADELLRPLPDDFLELYEVSTVVNSPRNDVPECVARL